MALPKLKNKLPLLNEEAPTMPELEGFEHYDTTEDVVSNEEQEIEAEERPPIPQRAVDVNSKYDSFDDELFIDEPQRHRKYIDKKKKKIVPIGGKKAKIKDKDLDARKNKLTGVKLFRLFVYICILLLVGLGMKNALFPQKSYTADEIASIALSSIGQTGFPEKRGEAFARDFLKSYLNMTDVKSSKQMLSKFYTGQIDEGYGSETGRTTNEANLKAIGEPILFESLLLSENNATFKYNVYTTNVDGKDVDEEGGTTGQWMAFSINVFYDKDTDTVSIVDNPTMIPTYAIKKPETLPDAVKLGNGILNNEMSEKLNPTITGFLKAYANVSVFDYDEILQYIPNKKPPELLNGFNGTVEIADTSDINYKVYDTDNSNEWKVDVQVNWKMAQVSDELKAPKFLSRYVMTIKKTKGNVYLVTKFTPYIYVSDIK